MSMINKIRIMFISMLNNNKSFTSSSLSLFITKCTQLFFFLVVLCFMCSTTVNGEYTKNCHYSCAYCGSPDYSHCIICQQPFKLSPIKNADNIKQYYNTLQQQPWGTCLGLLPQTNAFGILIVIVNILALIYFRNRTIFYITSSLQTMSLFSFIEIAEIYPISYTLQSLQYFMFVTSLNRPNRQVKLQIYDDQRYRMWEFLNSYNFQQNFTPVFIMSIICFGVALIVPIARYLSKSQSSLWSICYCAKLQKIFTYMQIGSLVTFFFLIQQSILIIAIGLFLDGSFNQQQGNIVMVVIYILILILMIVNICMKNLQVFSNKIGQQIQVLKKCMAPLFIVLPLKAIIAVTAFVFVLQLLAIIFAKLSSKQYKRSYFHQCLIKREIKYRVIQLIVVIMIAIYYLIETQVKSYEASSAASIVAVTVISIYLTCLLVEIGIQLYGKFYLKQTQQLYQKTGFQLSSLRQSKVLQETIENFETTDQGIMDMVFFGRSKGQQQTVNPQQNIKKQKKTFKKSNIHLTLDQLNESIENNQNNMNDQIRKFTPSVSPKHNRQLEKHLKSKTSRTPKNDRTSRFKLNKAFQHGGEEQINDIQKISIPKMSMTRQENDNVENNTKDEDHSINEYVNGEKTTQRSFDNANMPKTSRHGGQNGELKKGGEIKIQIDTEELYEQCERSPRFNVKKGQQSIQMDDHQKDDEKIKHLGNKDHILNINNSEQQNQQDLEEIEEKNETTNAKQLMIKPQQQINQIPQKETKGFKAVKKNNSKKHNNNK